MASTRLDSGRHELPPPWSLGRGRPVDRRDDRRRVSGAAGPAATMTALVT